MTNLWRFTILLLSGLLTVQGEYINLEWKPLEQFEVEKQKEFPGVDYDAKPIFVVRVEQGTGHVIGNYYPKQNIVVYFVHGEGVLTKSPKDLKAQVLVYGKWTLDWTERVAASVVKPPPNLLLGGFDPDTKEPFHICRMERNGHVEPGSFRFSEAEKGCLSVEGTYKKVFELVSLGLYGIASGAGN